MVLPLPDDVDEEVEIVASRVRSLGARLELPADLAAHSPRSAGWSRCSANCAPASPQIGGPAEIAVGTLSTAEAISVMTNGLRWPPTSVTAVRAADVAAGLVGAVVKDPVQDRVVWQEYLETVVREPARLEGPLPGLP